MQHTNGESIILVYSNTCIFSPLLIHLNPSSSILLPGSDLSIRQKCETGDLAISRCFVIRRTTRSPSRSRISRTKYHTYSHEFQTPSPPDHLATMSPSLLPSLLLILVVALSPHFVSAASIVNKTCKAVEKVRSVDYDFCMETLYAVPKSTSANTRELALLAANLTKINITSIIDITEDLIENLNACIRYYREMKQSVTGSIGDIKAGNIENAIDKLQRAEDTPDDCDILLFEGRAMKNPLKDENLNANALAELTYSITSLLENKK